MRQSIFRFGSSALVAIGIALAGASAANAESVMKVCGAQWQAAKAAGTTNGETWQQFLAQCRTQQQSGAVGAPAPAPASAPPPAAPAPTYGQAPAGSMKTTSQCDAQYAANKAAIKASGQTKRAFVAACRAGNETIPQGTAAAPAPAPAPAPSGGLFPWQQPAAPAPAPASANYGAPPAVATSASAQQAQARCPGAPVVWVNDKSHIYHFVGTRSYGTTKHGEYMCEADAQAAGNRAAKNEKHP